MQVHMEIPDNNKTISCYSKDFNTFIQYLVMYDAILRQQYISTVQATRDIDTCISNIYRFEKPKTYEKIRPAIDN
jgi:hypothetical protein